MNNIGSIEYNPPEIMNGYYERLKCFSNIDIF
jgi:hypothetical protein